MELIEVAALAVAAAIFAIGAGIAGRWRGELGYWAWSCALLVAAGLLLQLGADWPAARAGGAVLAVLFPGLQLAGAIEHTGFLSKPFRARALVDAVWSALDAERAQR